MSEPQFVTLNGFTPSWVDLACTISVHGGALVDMADFAALNWSDTVEVGTQAGASGGRIKKRSTGSVTQEASATMYRSGHKQMVQALANVAPADRSGKKRISLAHFDIVVQHTPPGDSEIYTVKILGCRLLGRAGALAEGNDADKVEITLNPMQIVEVMPDGTEIILL